MRGGQIVACSCLKSSYEDRSELFSAVADDMTKAIATTCILVKRPFFIRRVMQHGNRLLE